MRLRALVAGGLVASVLGACAVVDPVDSRYDTVTRSLAKARNEAIFLNLIRASYDSPLSFNTIANVTPTMTNTSSFALPTFSSGPPNCILGTLPGTTRTCTFPMGAPGADVLFGSSTASNSTAVSTNFNVSTEETGSFYEGFLKPIDLTILDYFIRQGYPRELLFWLLTDSFELTLPGHRPLGFHYHPPDDLGYDLEDQKHRCFTDWVHIATFSGLTVEKKHRNGQARWGSEAEVAEVAATIQDPQQNPPRTLTRAFASTTFWQSKRYCSLPNSRRRRLKMRTSRRVRFLTAPSNAGLRLGIPRRTPRIHRKTYFL